VNILKLRRKLLYLFTALAILGTLFRQVFYVPLYTAQTSLSVQKAENSPMQLALANIGAAPVDNGGDHLKKYLDYIQSNEFFLAVAETLKYQEGYSLLNLTSPSELSITKKKFWNQFFGTHFGHHPDSSAAPDSVLIPVEKLAGIVRGMTSGESNGSDSMYIRVTSMDPFTSMVLANTASEVFVKKTTERDYNEVTEVKRFITDELGETTENLKRVESLLVDFKKRHNIISISDEHQSFSAKLNSVETESATTAIQFQENQKLIEFYNKALDKLENRLLSQGSSAAGSSRSDLVARLRQQLDSLRYKKILMQAQGFSENSWQMTEINRDIDKTASQLKTELASPKTAGASEEDDLIVANPEAARKKLEELKTENKLLETKLATVDKSKSVLLKSLETLPKDEQVLLTLTRDVDLQFELYSSLKKKLQEVEIQQVALQSHVSVIDRSGLPGPQPRTDLVVKMLFALLVGLFLGCTTAFLFEAIDPTVKHLVDLEAVELVALGSIPRVEGSRLRSSLGVHSYRPDLLICKEKPESPESMAFKHVRAQIMTQRSSDGGPARVILITSPERGDGKSFSAGNLAVSLSQLEKKTLLIDCDFRNPSQPWLFGYREGHGLSSLLSLKASLDEVLIRNRLPHLDILPAGWSPPNPSELISNDKFRVLLEHLKSLYDYLVIDAPPAVAVVDASVLASHADSVVMVAGFRKTKKDMLLMALRKILMVSHKHIYGLLNNVWETHGYVRYGSTGSFEPGTDPKTPVDARSDLERFEHSLTRRKAG
jgi:tyrosine-protein kinase Etk/Wzc